MLNVNGLNTGTESNEYRASSTGTNIDSHQNYYSYEERKFPLEILYRLPEREIRYCTRCETEFTNNDRVCPVCRGTISNFIAKKVYQPPTNTPTYSDETRRQSYTSYNTNNSVSDNSSSDSYDSALVFFCVIISIIIILVVIGVTS